MNFEIMPALFVFLLKVNVALLLFCGGYYLVLRRLTFYTLNRIYLIIAILFSSAYPQVNLSGFAERHQQLAKPVQVAILNWQAPSETFIRPVARINYWYWAEIVFWTGAALLAVRLLVQLNSLYRLYRNSKTSLIYGHEVRVIENGSGPFSFWKSIYLNPANHKPEDLKAILLHEQVHINEWHTLDILLAELSAIFYWFNPGIWLMKKAIRENIEFITDRKILNTGIDTKQYQYSLVNVSFNASPQGIVNHFNISTIKKRIIMMNAKRSSKLNLTRYAFLVPALIALLLVFTISKAVSRKTNGHINPYLSGILKQAVGIKQNKPLLPLINIEKVRKENAQTADTNNVPATTHKLTGQQFTAADTALLRKRSVIGLDQPVVYVVDGKVLDTTSTEIKKLKPEDIESMTIGNNGKLLFINTKNRAIKGVTVTGNGTTNLSVSATNGMDTNRVTKVRINGQDYKAGTVSVTNVKLANFDTVKFDTLVRDKLNHHVAVTNVSLSGLKTLPGYTFSSFGSTFSLNHLSDKLIIIDGKIATEADLKKLSAFDIDRMVLKTDEETTELYGKKARNGIVFIVTKKDGK